MKDSRLPLLVYFGHHKCASLWIRAILSDVCTLTNLRIGHMSRPEELQDASLPALLARVRPDMLFYSNAAIEHVPVLGPLRGFHVVRDPRDIVVSGYFSHLYSHRLGGYPGIVEHRQRLQSASKTAGLLLEMDFDRQILGEIYAWNYEQPNILEVRLEDLMHSPYEGMAAIMTFLGLTRQPTGTIEYGAQFSTLSMALINQLFGAVRNMATRKIPADRGGTQMPTASQADRPSSGAASKRRRLLKRLVQPEIKRRNLDMANLLLIVYRHRFANMAGGRSPGQEDQYNHYRKGIAGDWVNHFEPVHIEYFKHHYNDVLLKLGYVTTPDWK